MKILIVHNTYQQPGGEDVVVAAETRMLEQNGHTVIRYSRSNDEIAAMSGPERLMLVKNMIRSERSKQQLYALLRAERPDLVHVHNTFLMISPSVFESSRDAGIPSVQTLHNYRLLCPGWTLSREGAVCEECLHRGLWRGVWHGCYRNSRLMTAAVALMLQTHRTSRTWEEAVDGYVALTNFARSKFIQGGLPAAAIHVKPNFLDVDPGERTSVGRSMLFIGRLSPEKGVDVLLKAWEKLSTPIPLVIFGDGPLRKELEAQVAAKKLTNITFVGWQNRTAIFAALKNAAALIAPSLCYEGFPMTLVEAFACGTPVICSGFGGLAEIVEDGRTGLHFRPGDEDDLAGKIEWACDRQGTFSAMGREARAGFEKHFTAKANYQLLLEIYEKAIAHAAMN
jgi:glycosyltransferase involved in cell wall biosynthesis